MTGEQHCTIISEDLFLVGECFNFSLWSVIMKKTVKLILSESALFMRKFIFLCLIIALLCICLSGCVPGDGTNSNANPAGLFSGIWHGWIAPFSLVYSIFSEGTGIYEIHNNGFLYNLGYYAAIISGFGGLALFRRKEKK